MNLMATKSKSKIKFIIRNPRFFINVKEQIKNSVKALSGAKIGTRFNRNAVPRTIESQRDKVTSKNIISIIRSENMQTDSRPFSAFPLQRTHTFRMSQEKPPSTAHERYNFKNISINTIK